MWARRLGLGRNPLRRPIDRLESGLILLAMVSGLLMVPIGAAIGTSVRNASEHHAAQQRSILRQVQAKTTEDAPPWIADLPGQVTAGVGVVWQEPGGFTREGRTDVYLGTKADSEVTIWLDGSGQISVAPRPPGDSAARGGAVGLTVVMGSWSVLWLLVLVVRQSLDRRRLRDWADQWERVAPLWSRRRT